MKTSTESAPPASETPPTAGAPAGKPLPTKKAGASFGKRLARWLLGFLIVLGAGFLLAVYFLYIPARDQVNRSAAELRQAQQQITELVSQGESFTSVQTENQGLQSQLDQAELHIALLSARNDAANAQLALAKNEPDAAKTALIKTPNTLKRLEPLLGSEHSKTAAAMQERLSLVIQEIETDPFAAQSDLTVLATNLMQLENTLFATP